jgi:hypothetical protein
MARLLLTAPLVLGGFVALTATTDASASVPAPSVAIVSFAQQGCSTWLVPAGVSSVDVEAVGAAGGAGGSDGGDGDGQSASISGLTPDVSTFDICVDQGGGAGSNGGGSGGGASGASLGLTFSAPFIVAAGGGGGGGGDRCSGRCGSGAGGTPGTAGVTVIDRYTLGSGVGGGGATTSTVGTGGAGSNVNDGYDGSPGTPFDAAGPGVGGIGGTSGDGGGGGGGGGGFNAGGGGGGTGGGFGGAGGGGGADFCGNTYAATVTVNGCTTSPGAGTGSTAGGASGDPEVTVTYDLPTPTLSLIDPSGAPTAGSNTYDVTLTVPQGGPAPSQSVAVTDGTQNCSASLSNPSTNGTTWTGSCALDNEQANATVSATYPTDTNYSATTAPTLTVTQGAATLSLIDPSGAPTAGSNTYDVTLTVPQRGPAPSQSVAVTDGTQNCSASLLNPSANGTTWTGSCALNNEQANATVSASYEGDANYANASASTLTVGRDSATLSLIDPSGTPKAGNNTYDVTLTVPQGAPAPSQSVAVTDGAQNCSASLLNPSTNGTTWTGSCELNNEQANATVSASYGGDANYANASAPTTLIIGKATPTLSTTVTGSATSGQSITATASLGGGDVPGGTIIFKAYASGTCVGTVAFTSASPTSVSGDGHYAATGLSTTTPGTYYLTASYSGDGNDTAITSACSAAFSVSPATTPPTFTSSTTAYFSWLGANTTFHITASGSPVPTITEVGPLPQGLHFNSSTDTISGVAGPLALGSHTVALIASNGVGATATQKLVIVVGFTPVILTPPTTTFTVGRPGSFTFVSCSSPMATLSESGALPPGATFTAFNNGTAELSGVPGPQSLSSYVITVTANSGFATSSQTFLLRVVPPKK